MKLCLVRHAIAAERGAAYPDDDLRPLTPEGRLAMERAAAGLAVLVHPAALLSSPLVRAVQTAEIVGRAWGLEIQQTHFLASDGYDALLERVAAAGVRIVALVGHEPWLGELASYLLTSDPNAVAFEVKKGAAILVDGEPRAGGARLEWAIPPGALRKITASGG